MLPMLMQNLHTCICYIHTYSFHVLLFIQANSQESFTDFLYVCVKCYSRLGPYKTYPTLWASIEHKYLCLSHLNPLELHPQLSLVRHAQEVGCYSTKKASHKFALCIACTQHEIYIFGKKNKVFFMQET